MSVRETLAESPREPDRRIGRYEIRCQIGRGGFGAVYQAFDPQLQRDVALKILMRASPKARQRFDREVQAVARLRHPNIVSIHDSGEEGGRPYLVMEFVKGGTFEALVREGRFDLRTRVRLVRDVARAIQYAHDQGVLHRDLKPENVLVDEHGVAHVLDFGLAYLEEESGLQRLSISGIPMGTPAYMAPEQASGRRPDHRTDVWGLGGVLYFALVGEGPYERFNNPLIAVQNEPVRPPREVDPQLPATLERICMRCLAKPPEERYASPRELERALADYLERGDTLRLDGQRGQAALAAAGLVAAVGVGLLVFGWARAGRVEPRPAVSPTLATSSPPETPAPTTPEVTPTPPPDAPVSAQAQEVARLLERARELGAKVLDSSMVLEQLTRAARLAGDERDLAEQVALETVRHHIRRKELQEATAALESFPWKTAGLADRLRLELYLAMEDEPRAKRLLPRMAEGDPNAVGTVLARAWKQLIDDNDPDTALYTGRRAVELDPHDVAALMFVAQLYLLREEPRRGIEYMQRAREASPDDHRPLQVLALLLQDSDPRASLQAFDDLVHVLGDGVTAAHVASRGVLRSKLGDAEGAEADLKQALDMDAEDFTANMALAVLYLQRGNPEAARPHLVQAQGAEPEAFRRQLLAWPGDMRERVREMVGLDDASRPLNDALREWIQVRAERVEEPEARAALLAALEAAARGRPWAEVGALLDRAAAAAPDSQPLLLERLRLACRRDAFAVAEAALARARELGLGGLELDLLEAELHGRRGDFLRAGELYVRIANAAPKSPPGLTARASVLVLEGSYEEAMAVADRSLELDSTQTACRALEVICVGNLTGPQLGRRQAELAIDAYGLIDSRLPLLRYRFKLHELGRRFKPGEGPREAQLDDLQAECGQLAELSAGAEPYLVLAAFLVSYPQAGDALARTEQLLGEAEARHADLPGLWLQRSRLAIQRGDAAAARAAARRVQESLELPKGVEEEFQRAFGEPMLAPEPRQEPDPAEGGGSG